MTSEVIKALKEVLTPVCPSVYFGRSAIVYPKINGDLKQVSDLYGKLRYRLVLDFFVKDEPPTAAVTLAENARKALDFTQIKTDSGYIAVYHDGNAYFSPDNESEKITQYSDSYEISAYKTE